MKRLLLLTLAALMPSLAGAQAPKHADAEIIPAPATTLPLKHAPEPTSAAISAADLMTRLYIFADDSMQGREAGTIGNVKGTNYIAAEAKRIGLVPAGDNGTYFQTLPFKTRAVDSASKFIAGGVPISLGSEWVSASPATISQPNLGVVFGGVLGDSMRQIHSGEGAGKLIVYAMAPGPAGMASLRARPRGAGDAAAVAIIGPDMMLGFFRQPSTFVDDPTNTARPQGKPTLFITAGAAAKLFAAPVEQLAAGTAGKTATLDLRMKIAAVPFPARNVIGILPGSDPVLKNEYVAIGAHNDHIGFNHRPVDHDSLRLFNHIVRPGGAEDQGAQATPAQQAEVNEQLAAWRKAHPNSMRLDSIYNGADDDGSGSVSVLEIAEKMAALTTKPKRSTLFVWHVGEEKGLLGSEYFTDHPTVPRDSIIAQLNIDMVGRGNAWDVTGKSKEGEVLHGNPAYLQLVGSRRLSSELGDLADEVNDDDGHGLDFDNAMDANGHPMNIYCRSDHYEYARYGIPIIFFTTGGHSDYHQVTDEPQYIDYLHMAKVDSYIEDLARHIGDIERRLSIDQPRPDPHGSCKQ